jgi:hypothetical protein
MISIVHGKSPNPVPPENSSTLDLANMSQWQIPGEVLGATTSTRTRTSTSTRNLTLVPLRYCRDQTTIQVDRPNHLLHSRRTDRAIKTVWAGVVVARLPM